MGKTVLQNLITIAAAYQLTHRSTFQNALHKVLAREHEGT